MSWAAAEAWCLEAHGQHLASFQNWCQNAAASAVCGENKCWIGATCQDGTWGDWKWSDGTNWSYTEWNSGEPNDWNGAEDCVHQHTTGLWNDAGCDSAYYALCAVAGISCHDAELKSVPQIY